MRNWRKYFKCRRLLLFTIVFLKTPTLRSGGPTQRTPIWAIQYRQSAPIKPPLRPYSPPAAQPTHTLYRLYVQLVHCTWIFNGRASHIRTKPNTVVLNEYSKIVGSGRVSATSSGERAKCNSHMWYAATVVIALECYNHNRLIIIWKNHYRLRLGL